MTFPLVVMLMLVLSLAFAVLWCGGEVLAVVPWFVWRLLGRLWRRE